jgi:hypothetical protein
MDHGVDIAGQVGDELRVVDVAADDLDAEVFDVLRSPGPEVVEDAQRVSVVQEQPDQVGSDETRPARDE